jgi:hypothetical protein
MENNVIDAASGAAIDRMCRRALEALRAAPPTVQPQVVEKSNAEIAVDLQRKAMPAARLDASVIRRAAAENEIKRRAAENSWAQARMERPYED